MDERDDKKQAKDPIAKEQERLKLKSQRSAKREMEKGQKELEDWARKCRTGNRGTVRE